MLKAAREELKYQVQAHEADGTLEQERPPIGSVALYYNKRPLMVVDLDILVAVHDSMEFGAHASSWQNGSDYDLYRSTLNI